MDDHGDRWRGRLAIPRCGIAGVLAGSQQEGHLVVIDRRAGAEDRQRSEDVEEPPSGGDEAGGSEEHRQNGRRVVVWTLRGGRGMTN